MAELKTRILLRNDILANWTSKNPVLGKGEFAAVYDPTVSGEGRKIRVKVGDGVSAFNALPYVSDYDAEILAINQSLDTKMSLAAETYNLPYYFEVLYEADKVVVKDYTVDLNTGAKREYSLDIAAATTEKAGIMTAADKIEVNKVANKADKSYVDEQDEALDERIQALEARGRFLSSWNAVEGKPETDPTTVPYELKAGDYFIVSVVATAEGQTNKQPEAKLIEGKYYYDGSVSKTGETRELGIGDYYTFDGTKYVLVQNSQKTVSFANIAGVARDNINLKGELEALEGADADLAQAIEEEAAARIAGDNDLNARKVEKDITSTAGKARIFNEADGGGAKFENVDGTASFAGVNSDTNGGIGAQLYDIDVAANKGAKLDVTKNGIFYTQGDASAQPAATRDVEANEIAVKKNVSDEADLRSAADTELQNKIDAETAARIAADNTKTDKEVVGANGTAYIFNEADGGGAKFVNNDGVESFVGVNDGGANGLVAQIYADKLVDGKWQGAKIDVKNTGIYYTVGNKSAAERDIADNEIAVKKNVSDAVAAEAEIARAAEQANADAIDAEASRAGQAEEALQSGKLDIMPGNEQSGGNAYNLPYFFYQDVQADKVVVHTKTRSLDGNNVYGDYSMDVNAATAEKAGLMTAADKVALEGKQDQLTAGDGVKIENNTIGLDLTQIVLYGGNAEG